MIKTWSVIILIFLFGFSISLDAQSGITFFVNSELDRILDMAKRENKDVFIDTYTQWCVPCKKLDRVFTDRELGRYFNDNFINVKFDMETEAGKVLVNRYDVFFMPTLLILDKNGNIKLKWDRGLVDAQELLKMALRTEHPEQFASTSAPPTQVSESRAISPSPSKSATVKKSSQMEVPEGHEVVIEKNPITGSTIVTTKPKKQTETIVAVEKVEEKQIQEKPKEPIPATVQNQVTEKQVFSKDDISSADNEKILYVMDSGEGPPDFVLYEEAYFRLQLMDGSHNKAAKAYLKTQEDWLSEKNMRFLNDFLYSTNSEEFAYYIAHRAEFEKLLGNNQVLQTIIILSNNQLERGYPRPSLEEANRLYTLMGYAKPAESANRYYLNRLFEQDTPENYIKFAKDYCKKEGDQDHFEMNRLATLQATTNPDKKHLKSAVKLLKKAISLDTDNYEYLESLAYVYFKAKNKNKALESIQNAKLTAQAAGVESKLNQELVSMINSL